MTDRRVDKTAEQAISGPVWVRIADDIAAAIGRGEHPEGALLPGAAELATRYDVNRHTVRQALLHLQSLGLLAVERGRGTTVVATRVPYRIGRRVSFRTNFAAAGLAATSEILSAVRRPALESEAARLNLPAGQEIWCVGTLNRAAGVPVSTSLHLLAADRFPDFPDQLRAANASITAAFAYFGIDHYERLTTRLVADLATDDEAARLDLAPGSPVMRSDAVDGLPDGTPLQALTSAFAASRVQMVIESDDDGPEGSPRVRPTRSS